VVDMLGAVGLAGPLDGRRPRAIFIGVALGLSGAIFAYGYLMVLRSVPGLDSLNQRAQELENMGGQWLVVLAVIAAPLFEEFIFRGLVFRGLRRSISAPWAVAGSAAVFAICHPPISVVPVFVMGSLAAIGFEWTGWIVTPICVHMTYNALVLLPGLLAHGNR